MYVEGAQEFCSILANHTMENVFQIHFVHNQGAVLEGMLRHEEASREENLHVKLTHQVPIEVIVDNGRKVNATIVTISGDGIFQPLGFATLRLLRRDFAVVELGAVGLGL